MDNCKYFFIRIILHVISSVGAVVAFYLLYQYNSNYCMVTSDASGIIIPTLSIMVTLLVGWNIYSALGIEGRFNEALSVQKQHEKEQKTDFENLKNETYSKIKSIENEISRQVDQQVKQNLNSAKYAYIYFFNTTQAQMSAAINDVDYLQQYSYYQMALNALLQCNNFPSDIRINIKVALAEMDKLMELLTEHVEEKNDNIYNLHFEHKKEFIQTMEEISKSPREEFSFEDRQKFIEISVKAKKIFDAYYKTTKV